MGSSRKNRECYRWKKPILIGARRVLDKIICDLKFTKKKKKKLYNTLSQDLILLRTSVPSTLILDGWKIFFYTRLQIKEVGIRKRIRIVILWVIVFCLINKIVLKLNLIQSCLINFDIVVLRS